MGGALLFYLLVFSLGTLVRAADAESSPCDGRGCSWILENHHSLGKTQSTFRLGGSSSAISDLTPAAGWTILDCKAGVKAQTIRAVCTGESSSCDQLHEGGAAHTLVRLPEDCGNGLFARVVSEQAHENQTVPSDVSTQLRRRGQSYSVRAITIDTQFGEIDPLVHGPVTFSVDGRTIPQNANTPPPSRALNARSKPASIASFVSNAAFVPSSASTSSSSAAPNATDVGTDNPTSFNKTGSTSFHFDDDRLSVLVNQTIQCELGDDELFDGHITLQALMDTQLDVEYGIQISGTVIPPHIEEFDMFARFNASLDITFLLDIIAEVTINAGNVTFFQAGLPGISISDVLDIGPFFQLSGGLNASAIADGAMLIDSMYNIENAEVIFPPSSGPSTGLFQQGGAQFIFEFQSNVSSNGTAEVALVPAVLFGVNIFDGRDKATIGLNVDGQGSIKFDTGPNAPNCAEGSSEISVNVDAEGKIEGVFDKSLSFVIFEDQFEIFNGCPANMKRDMSHDSESHQLYTRTLQRRSLECFTSNGIPGTNRFGVGNSLPPGPFLPANMGMTT